MLFFLLFSFVCMLFYMCLFISVTVVDCIFSINLFLEKKTKIKKKKKITTKVRRVITKLILLVSKDLKKSDEILEFCTEQEITFVEIFWSNRILSSLPKTSIFSHQSERSIFSEKTSEKSYFSDSHYSKSSRSFCSTSHFSKSAKSKAPSSYISKPSEKKPSAHSNLFYCATGSSSAS